MNRLRELRKKRGIFQEDLAAELYVSRRQVSRWELGISEPNMQNLCFLANYFNVSIDYLVGRSDKKKGEIN